jgi:AcrR family transcriptional regulator
LDPAVSGGRTPGGTRTRILGAALELFVARGFDGTSISDIERAVGLAAGTGSFYRHFPSKEAVFVASFEAGVAQRVEQAFAERAELDDIDDPAERRRRDYLTRLQSMERFIPLWGLVVAERHRFPMLMQAFVAALGMENWDAGWATDRGAAVGFAAIVGYSQLELLADGPFRDVAGEEFVDAVVDLVTPPGRAEPAERPDG